MGLRVLWLLLLSLASSQTTKIEAQAQQIIGSDDVEGYSIATVHVVDPVTKQLVGQSKRDIKEHASDSTSDKSVFTLHLENGERLRMSLSRRSVDTSGAVLVEEKEDGEREESELETGDCYFSGPLEGEKGFAAISMCDGDLIGTITTAKRNYEVYEVPGNTSKRSEDDLMHVLVTWQSVEQSQENSMSGLEAMKRQVEAKINKREADDDDALEIPTDESATNDVGDDRPISLPGKIIRKATIEVADIVDSYHLNAVTKKLGITNMYKLANMFINKWNGVASAFFDKKRIGWNITVKLVRLELWRKNPSWYTTTPKDRMIDRMRMVCKHHRRGKFDQITLHTGDPVVRNGKVGVAWMAGLCGSLKCSTVRFISTGYFFELHEFGHSLGLNHDNKMPECQTDNDPVNGFMGGNRDHFKLCYRGVIDSMFAKCSDTDGIIEELGPLDQPAVCFGCMRDKKKLADAGWN